MMNLAKMSDPEILKIAEPMMDNIIKSSTDIDYIAHVRDFRDRIKEKLDEPTLHQMCETYQNDLGFLTKRKLLHIFRRPDSVAII